MRALVFACAVISLLFAVLMGLCTVLAWAAGGGALQGVLGLIWTATCTVCGVVALRAALARVQPEKEV